MCLHAIPVNDPAVLRFHDDVYDESLMTRYSASILLSCKSTPRSGQWPRRGWSMVS